MKKILILLFSLISLVGFAQTQIDPSLAPTTARVNAAIKGSLTATGTNTYTTTLSGFTIVSGDAIDITFTNANSGASTFNLNGSAAITLKKFSSGSLVDLVSGDISNGERKRFYHNGTFLVIEGGTGSGGGGSGTVTTASVVTANGVSATVANPTTTPAFTFTLGAITPTTVNTITFSGSSTPTLSVTGTSSISGSHTGTHSGTSSGTNTGDQTLNSLLPTQTGNNGKVLQTDGSSATWQTPGAASLIVGSSSISSGTNTKVLFDNSGTLGEYTVSGTGSVAMTASTTLTGTPLAPTASPGTNTTQIVNGAYVEAIRNGTVQTSISGTEKIPTSGASNPAITPNLIKHNDLTTSNSPITLSSPTDGYARSDAPSQLTLADGTILIAYTGYPGSVADAASAEIVGVTSSDGGATWSTPTVLVGLIGGKPIYIPSLYMRNNGSVFMIVFLQPTTITGEFWKIESTDGGHTFTGAQAKIYGVTAEYYVSASNRIFKTSTGKLLYPFGRNTNGILLSATGNYEGKLLSSSDDGVTWGLESGVTIASPDNIVAEPGIVEEFQENLVVPAAQVLRYYWRNRSETVLAARSTNDGVAFSTYFSTGIRAVNALNTIIKDVTHDMFFAATNKTYTSGSGARNTLYLESSFDGKTWNYINVLGYNPTTSYEYSQPALFVIGETLYVMFNDYNPSTLKLTLFMRKYAIATLMGSRIKEYDAIRIKTGLGEAVATTAFGIYNGTQTEANAYYKIDHFSSGASLFTSWIRHRSINTNYGAMYSFVNPANVQGVEMEFTTNGSSTPMSGSASLLRLRNGSDNGVGGTVPFDVRAASINTTIPVNIFAGSSVAGTAPIKMISYVLTTTAAAGTGSTATISYSSTSPTLAYQIGQTILVSGVTPSGYNGTFVVTACSNTTVSYANATTGSQTVAGTITSPMETTPSARSFEVDPNGGWYETNLALNRYGKNGKIAGFFASVSNTSTTETDLFTYTTKANTLGENDEELTFSGFGTFNDITATNQLKFSFAGTSCGDTGALTISSTGAFEWTMSVKRTGTTTASCGVKLSTGTTVVYVNQADLTSLTLTGTNIIKITGTAAGASGGTGDITAKHAKIIWEPATHN